MEPIFSEKGELCGYFSLNENVTGRKEELHRSRYRQQQLESERALLEQERIISQKTLKSVIRCAPSAIVITNTEHVITSFNPAAETLLGYSAEEIIGKETPALFHDMDEVIGKARKLGWDGDENAVVFDELVPYFQRGISNLEEWFYISKSGERIPVLLGLTSLSDDDGEVIGFMGFVTDLRDQISAEPQRKQMLTRLEKITRQLPGFIYEYLQNPDGSSTFPYASSGIERIYGVTPAQAAQDASLVWKAIYPEDIPRVKESISASMQIANEWNCDYRIMGKEGSLRWASGSANPERLVDGSVVWHGYIADNTERLDAELALAQKTSLLQLLTETALNFINVPIDQADRAIENSLGKIGEFFNVDRVYVFKYDSNLGISINTHEWCSDGIEPFIDQLQNVPIEWDSEWYFKHAKGEEVQISDVSAMPSCSVKEILSMQGIQSILSVPMMHDGESIGFVGFDAVETQRHFDTDEIKLLQVFSRALVSVRSRIDDHHALKDSQAQLESFFEVALDLFCICDSEGRFLRVSHAWEIFLGLSNEQIVGRYFIDFVHPEDRSATQIAMQDLADGQKIDEFVNRYL